LLNEVVRGIQPQPVEEAKKEAAKEKERHRSIKNIGKTRNVTGAIRKVIRHRTVRRTTTTTPSPEPVKPAV
jgi:hypothetical protein